MKEMSGGITEHVTTLNRVLTNVKARGTWAEVQLKNILDQTIPNMYVENYAPSISSKERVEFAIKIPSGENYSEIIYLPVDSKFPMEDYVRLCDATEKADAEGAALARKALEERIIREARSIRKYINVPATTPFAIMYLASEGLYAEIASSPNAIPEKLQNEFNIMVAGPSTITALLNSLSMGFRIAAINEKANEVRKILSAIKSQYDTFSGVLAKAKKKIDEAGRSLDEAQHRNDIIQKKLKNIEEVGRDEGEEILGIKQALLADEEGE
jgi:DNA recombination protein RmuC